MLFYPASASKPIRVQGAFVSDSEVEKIVDFVKSNSVATYNEEFSNLSASSSSSGSGNSMSNDTDDDAYNDVVEFAISTGKISASLIQRRFRFGYNRAARMMDLLESRGIVGPQNGSKPREVLVKLDPNQDDK